MGEEIGVEAEGMNEEDAMNRKVRLAKNGFECSSRRTRVNRYSQFPASHDIVER